MCNFMISKKSFGFELKIACVAKVLFLVKVRLEGIDYVSSFLGRSLSLGKSVLLHVAYVCLPR